MADRALNGRNGKCGVANYILGNEGGAFIIVDWSTSRLDDAMLPFRQRV